VHTHSTYATLMACLGKPVEPIHYLIGFAGGEVPVTPYIIFGTETLAQEAVRIMGASRNAVLLGNHGLLAVGKNLPAAFNVAEETEFVAELNYKAMCVGGCKTISEELFRETMVKFETYGQQLGGR
jgi:L-fuculose-phosphate aldolase